MKLFLPIAAIFLTLTCKGQQEFGLSIVKELCSENYHGRGYVNDGHVKAANFIAKKFEEYGLKKFDDSYFQHFNIAVNTFPDSVAVSLNDAKLIPGKDFVVNPSSGSIKGQYQPHLINRNNIVSFLTQLGEQKVKFEKTIFILDQKDIEDKDTLQLFTEISYLLTSKSPVMVIKDSKFTWSVGREEFENPIIEIQRDKYQEATSSVNLNIHNEFVSDLKTQNLIGYVEGKNKNKYLVVSAHYDHLGRMGSEAYFPGANDNASGVAMLLYLAKYFSENKPKYSIAFMAFGAEEAGILGSKHYTENPLFPLKKIKFLVNCDIMGTGDEGITVVNGTIHKKQFKKLAILNNENEYLAKVKVRGRAANSDHYWFSSKQVPAIFIYTMGGIKAYHDVYDKSETLPLSEFNDLSQLLIDFLNKL